MYKRGFYSNLGGDSTIWAIIGKPLKLKNGKMLPEKKMIDNLLASVLSVLLVAFLSLGNFAFLDSFVPLGNALLLTSVSHNVTSIIERVLVKTFLYRFFPSIALLWRAIFLYFHFTHTFYFAIYQNKLIT
jgi:hypothetical protein